jgi:S-methylmethionine-dependent homocysteine/selenocysteine methylase
MSQRCIDAGATIVGGCCGIGPAYIKALADSLQQ